MVVGPTVVWGAGYQKSLRNAVVSSACLSDPSRCFLYAIVEEIGIVLPAAAVRRASDQSSQSPEPTVKTLQLHDDDSPKNDRF